MKIKWYGHACFKITSQSGKVIVTDPFDDSVGYEMPDATADIVTSSHDHFDHNHAKAIKGDFEYFTEPGEFAVEEIKIKGTGTFHDDSEGSKRGKNIIYTFNLDGLTVCHCGDLGHTLTEEHILEIGDVDVLLLPIGGTFTINAQQAVDVVKQLKPKVTIPMHYKTEVLDFPIDKVDKFLEKVEEWKKIDAQEIEITPDNINKIPKICVLDY